MTILRALESSRGGRQLQAVEGALARQGAQPRGWGMVRPATAPSAVAVEVIVVVRMLTGGGGGASALEEGAEIVDAELRAAAFVEAGGE